MQRGGHIDLEQAHAGTLLEMGAETTWGWGTPAGRRRVDARIAWFARALDLRPGMRVLECGCGTGVFTRRLAGLGIALTAVDVSDALLREAARACPAPNVTFVRTNLEYPVELEDGAFDAICGVSVLHHLDTKVALPAIRKKLKPGGRFAFSEPNLLNPLNKYVYFSSNPGTRKRVGSSPTEMAFTPQELRRELTSAGFTVRSLTHRDFLHPRTPPSLIPLVQLAASIAEATPGVRRISGSLWVSGTRD
ncbi:MAG TPA: class I SAM-dependent methyltransferase [Vicinamibacterales bacterium]|nr:class I SAM-dependent methyltransferase [Vicinamibacterales bacterium]